MSEPNTHPAASASVRAHPTAKQRRNALIQAGVAIVITVVIFGFVLPQVIDYQQVWETIRTLSALQLLVILAAGLVMYLPEGVHYAVLVPGLSVAQGTIAWIASTAVATTIPMMDLVTRFGMYRSYGASAEDSTLGIFLSGVFDNIVKFSLPVIAVLMIATVGLGDVGGDMVLVAGIALIILLATVGIAIGVVRSERFTERLAAWAQNVTTWIRNRLGREAVPDLADRIVGFRDSGVGLVKAVWWRALLVSAVGKLWTYVILTLAIRFVGIESDVLGYADIFIVWALVLLVQSIPITPGGVGLVEVAYVLLFAQVTGDEWRDTIAAAVALYRLVQWALPIPLGWGMVFLWRRQINRGVLPNPFGTDGA